MGTLSQTYLFENSTKHILFLQPRVKKRFIVTISDEIEENSAPTFVSSPSCALWLASINSQSEACLSVASKWLNADYKTLFHLHLILWYNCYFGN